MRTTNCVGLNLKQTTCISFIKLAVKSILHKLGLLIKSLFSNIYGIRDWLKLNLFDIINILRMAIDKV